MVVARCAAHRRAIDVAGVSATKDGFGSRGGGRTVGPLSVLLCLDGRVLVAYPVTSYGDDGLPIEHESMLTDAAVTVARSRTFTPLVSDSAPIAGWIQVQVAFRP